MTETKRIEYLSTCDDMGRCRFILRWSATYHPGHPLGEHRIADRAQVFFADPTSYGFPRP